MPRKLTTKEFIERARIIHGERYDYSKVEYTTYKSKIIIICPIHGAFWQTPCRHLEGYNCLRCACETSQIINTSTLNEFINKVTKIHGDKYDYSKVKYVNNKTKVCIICSEHGEFWQTPSGHLNGNGCIECAKIIQGDCRRSSTEQFISASINIHCNKYNYTKVEYTIAHNNVCIICPIHGEFWQAPTSHLVGHGCPHCYVDYTNSSYIHYVYQITNTINNMIYIGIHSTKHPDKDTYMGSGALLMEAQNRYGMRYFTKNIIEYHSSREEIKLREAELVNKNFVAREDTYNMICGG